MSKLKVYHHELRPNEYDEFYLKYEVDKVIEAKNKEIAKLKEQVALLQAEFNPEREYKMHIDDIERGLRAEIKKKGNEQYATSQCNVRQMCKDTLAKLEEQESEIAKKDKELRHAKYKRCLEMVMLCCDRWADNATPYSKSVWYRKWHKRWLELAEKFKEAK